MSDPTSDSPDESVRQFLSLAERQEFQDRIGDHVSAIVAAARDLQRSAVHTGEPVSDLDAPAPPVQMNIQVSLAAPGEPLIHIPLQAGGCASDQVPIFVQYVGGHFLTGEPYFVQDVWCV